ncbi:uncharacterized protein LOC120133721 [Hibiscus syriacus]|uniref:uncharacterized protein LOC120133721 n=1 Tax=Hibiscus syriacus TaxID=106335 RepID=UPI001921D1E4|nr:uncharacterized protein LOC120133721 [Hibiscus syriacus]
MLSPTLPRWFPEKTPFMGPNRSRLLPLVLRLMKAMIHLKSGNYKQSLDHSNAVYDQYPFGQIIYFFWVLFIISCMIMTCALPKMKKPFELSLVLLSVMETWQMLGRKKAILMLPFGTI